MSPYLVVLSYSYLIYRCNRPGYEQNHGGLWDLDVVQSEMFPNCAQPDLGLWNVPQTLTDHSV